MAAPQLPQLHVHFVIDPEGDLTIELMRDGVTYYNGRRPRTTEGLLATYLVSRLVLSKSCEVWREDILQHFKTSSEPIIQIEDGSVKSVELCFRMLHNTMIDEMYQIPIEDIWQALYIWEYRALDIKMLNPWFVGWMEKKDLKKLNDGEMAQLMTPCLMLDHAVAFAWITRRKAYESAEHIVEENPTEHHHLHLEHNVIGAINGARGSLRSKLMHGLLQPMTEFARCSCPCSAHSLKSYLRAVVNTGIWSCHISWKMSVKSILESPKLKNFSPKVPPCICMACMYRLNSGHALQVRDNVQKAFQGICIDCMDASKATTLSSSGSAEKHGMSLRDWAYWEHDRMCDWGRECRVQHGQATWYFSFMGRRADIQTHQQKMKRLRGKLDGASNTESMSLGEY